MLVLWVFPSFWYSKYASGGTFDWLREQSEIPGWNFQPIPVGQAAEAVLVADRIVSGEFQRSDGDRVRVFSAKRDSPKANQIGLFSHTPDRCWTAAGWNLENTNPISFEVNVQGVRLLLERRVFAMNNQQELVLFGGLVGGKALPYRMDQYYRASLMKGGAAGGEFQANVNRLVDGRLWGWAWQAFANRTPFAGPQHFIRVSTPVMHGDFDAAGKLLSEFIPKWLLRTH